MVDLAVTLLNYGVLGAWTAYLLYEKKVLLKQVIDSNHKLSRVIEDTFGRKG